MDIVLEWSGGGWAAPPGEGECLADAPPEGTQELCLTVISLPPPRTHLLASLQEWHLKCSHYFILVASKGETMSPALVFSVREGKSAINYLIYLISVGHMFPG